MKTIFGRRAPRVTALSTFLFAAAALMQPASLTAQDLDLSGEWVLSVESPNGTGERTVTFFQEGNEISGEISSSRAAGVLSGTIDGHDVTFIAMVEMDSGPFEITYTATVTDGEMKGTVDFGGYGAGTFTGHRKPSGVSGAQHDDSPLHRVTDRGRVR